MKHEWLQTVHAKSQENFLARRYMDDLLAFYAQRPDWDEGRFLQSADGPAQQAAQERSEQMRGVDECRLERASGMVLEASGASH